MRRAKPEKRELLPDIRFNSINVQTMVQHVLKSGKKSTAIRKRDETHKMAEANRAFSHYRV